MLNRPVKAGNPRDLHLAPDGVVQVLRIVAHAVVVVVPQHEPREPIGEAEPLIIPFFFKKAQAKPGTTRPGLSL